MHRDTKRFLWVLGFFGALALIGNLEGTLSQPGETSAQTEAREKAQAEADAERRAREMYLCHLKSVCSKYADVRQECATAGSYKTCVSIKMGDDHDLVDECTDAGNVSYPPDRLPSFARCLSLKLSEY